MKVLRTKEGKHKELISLYIRQRTDINKKIRQLQEEQATASNIKDKAMKKNTVRALERIIQYLKNHGTESSHDGLAVFCGSFQMSGHKNLHM